MKIYLDTSALNRIFDDQSQARIYLESTAMELAFLLIETGDISVVSSEALVFETNRNPYLDRRVFVETILQRATQYQSLTEMTVARAKEIELSYGIKGLDALHLACAEALSVDYFITCDDRLIRKYSGALKTSTPTAFISTILSNEE